MNGANELDSPPMRDGLAIGDVVVARGRLCEVVQVRTMVVLQSSHSVVVVERISVWRRLRIWLRDRWPFQFRGFWARVWTR